MGGSIELFYNTAATLPEEMFIPEKDDLLELGITTTNHFMILSLNPTSKEYWHTRTTIKMLKDVILFNKSQHFVPQEEIYCCPVQKIFQD